MNERDTEPLDETIRELLLAEKRPPAAPAAVRARVLSRLQSSLVAPDANGPHPSEGHPTADPTRFAARGVAGKMGPITIAFLAGGIAGASADRWLATPVAPQVVSVQSSTPIAQLPPPAPPELLPSTSASSPPVSTKGAAAFSTTPAESDLSAERELLDRARSAFAAGDPAATLASVNLHARRFPNGRLEEEREALAVKALVDAGRYDEARARGARFRIRFPRSFLSPTIDEALGTIP
jgi:hypothetical protein